MYFFTLYTARHSNHSIVGCSRSPQSHSLSMLMGLSHLPPPCDSNGEQYRTFFHGYGAVYPKKEEFFGFLG